MSIIVNQKPLASQPAQSPIVFSVTENTSSFVTASEFQYTANLYVWSGASSASGSYIYQLRKYPNQSGAGIFDVGRIINSKLTDLAATNPSNVKFYKLEVGWQYATGSTYVTQSGGLTQISCSVGGFLFTAYDGYAIFPDQINSPLTSQSAVFPMMTDAYLVTQSVTENDCSAFGNFASSTINQGSGSHGISFWRGENEVYTANYMLALTASYTNGTTLSASFGPLGNVNLTNTNDAISHYGFCPRDPGWVANFPTIPTASLDKWNYTIYSGSVALGTLNYQLDCAYYYEPVRIAWKNRFGQFDFLNFYKRHNTTFNTDQRLYQPQLGTWQSSTLSYNQFQTRAQRYIVDATEVLECNTDWLEQGYNDLMKQLLVSDEIYWMYDQSNVENVLVKPLTIKTNSLQFKTGVNNKLIQYTITFDIGQPYKLIL